MNKAALVSLFVCVLLYLFSSFVSGNVAQGMPCNISTMHWSDGYMFSNPCGAANNGNTSTEYEDGNCIHTAFSDPHPEWTVYLGQDYVIHSITIYARGRP